MGKKLVVVNLPGLEPFWYLRLPLHIGTLAAALTIFAFMPAMAVSTTALEATASAILAIVGTRLCVYTIRTAQWYRRHTIKGVLKQKLDIWISAHKATVQRFGLDLSPGIKTYGDYLYVKGEVARIKRKIKFGYGI